MKTMLQQQHQQIQQHQYSIVEETISNFTDTKFPIQVRNSNRNRNRNRLTSTTTKATHTHTVIEKNDDTDNVENDIIICNNRDNSINDKQQQQQHQYQQQEQELYTIKTKEQLRQQFWYNRFNATNNSNSNTNLTTNDGSNTCSTIPLIEVLNELAELYCSPHNLRTNFIELYRKLRPCLLYGSTSCSSNNGAGTTSSNDNDNNNDHITTTAGMLFTYPCCQDDSTNSRQKTNNNNTTTRNTKVLQNASIMLQGNRGCGKSRVLNNVMNVLYDEQLYYKRYILEQQREQHSHSQLQQVKQQQQEVKSSSSSSSLSNLMEFRTVRINGLLVPNYSITTVLQDILKQLTEIAFYESCKSNITTTNNTTNNTTTTNTQIDTNENSTDFNNNNNNNQYSDDDDDDDSDNDNDDKNEEEEEKDDDLMILDNVTTTTKEHDDNKNNANKTKKQKNSKAKQQNQKQYKQLKIKLKYESMTNKITRLKQTNFINQIQLLREILLITASDEIPILFILDEFDLLVCPTNELSTRTTRTNVLSTSANTTTTNQQAFSIQPYNNNNNNDMDDIDNDTATFDDSISVSSTMNNSIITSTTTGTTYTTQQQKQQLQNTQQQKQQQYYRTNTINGEHNPQVLLYHLFDHVATTGSYCSIICVSSNKTTISNLEKRVQSRFIGTTKILKFYSTTTTNTCTNTSATNKISITRTNNDWNNFYQQIILNNIPIDPIDENDIDMNDCTTDNTTDNCSAELTSKNNSTSTITLQKDVLELFDILSYKKLKVVSESQLSKQQQEQIVVYETFQRLYYNGRSFDRRWLNHVFYIAFKMYSIDYYKHKNTITNGLNNTNNNNVVNKKFTPNYLLDALVDMNVKFSPLSSIENAMTLHDDNNKTIMKKSKKNKNSCRDSIAESIVDDKKNSTTENDNNTGTYTTSELMFSIEQQERIILSNPQLSMLADLSGPQIAFILSCRRLILREQVKVESRNQQQYKSMYNNSNNNNNQTNFAIPVNHGFSRKRRKSDRRSTVAASQQQQQQQQQQQTKKTQPKSKTNTIVKRSNFLLTYELVYNEYRYTYTGNSGRYNNIIFEKAFYTLLQIGLIRPATDHIIEYGNSLMFSYDGTKSSLGRELISSSNNNNNNHSTTNTNTNILKVDRTTIHSTMPLKLTINIQSDIQIAYEYKIFHCPTSLLEWGNKLQ